MLAADCGNAAGCLLFSLFSHPQLLLAEQDLALTAEYYEAQDDGIVALLGLLDILPDVTDGHSGLFHAPDDL